MLYAVAMKSLLRGVMVVSDVLQKMYDTEFSMPAMYGM